MKAVCLISGGIDSPVAAYLMLKKGWELVFVHMDNSKEGKSRKKVEGVAGLLREKFSNAGKLYIVPYRAVLKVFAEKLERRYTCIFCKRGLLRVAQKIALEEDAECIVNGDNLAQVASQTLQNLEVVSKVSEIPIVRPLIGLDKEEIINIAKEVGTFDLAIKGAVSCDMVPEKPSTAARSSEIEKEEKNLDLDAMVEDCVEKSTVLNS